MSDMLKVVKGNVEYRIPAFKKKEYLELGYSILDGHGNVVVEGRPVTLVDHQQRIAELEKQLAATESEHADLQKAHAEVTSECVQLKEAYDKLLAAYNTLEASAKQVETKSTTSRKIASKANFEASSES